jgi:hypothetical protein
LQSRLHLSFHKDQSLLLERSFRRRIFYPDLILSLLNCNVEVMKVTPGRDKVDHLENSELTLPQHNTIADQRPLIRVDDGSGVFLPSYDITDFVIFRH